MIYKTFILLPGHKTNMISASHRRILSLLHSSSSGIFSSKKNIWKATSSQIIVVSGGALVAPLFIEYVAWQEGKHVGSEVCLQVGRQVAQHGPMQNFLCFLVPLQAYLQFSVVLCQCELELVLLISKMRLCALIIFGPFSKGIPKEPQTIQFL